VLAEASARAREAGAGACAANSAASMPRRDLECSRPVLSMFWCAAISQLDDLRVRGVCSAWGVTSEALSVGLAVYDRRRVAIVLRFMSRLRSGMLDRRASAGVRSRDYPAHPPPPAQARVTADRGWNAEQRPSRTTSDVSFRPYRAL